MLPRRVLAADGVADVGEIARLVVLLCSTDCESAGGSGGSGGEAAPDIDDICPGVVAREAGVGDGECEVLETEGVIVTRCKVVGPQSRRNKPTVCFHEVRKWQRNKRKNKTSTETNLANEMQAMAWPSRDVHRGDDQACHRAQKLQHHRWQQGCELLERWAKRKNSNKAQR